jgi:cobalamin biosynthesis protein CobT
VSLSSQQLQSLSSRLVPTSNSAKVFSTIMPGAAKRRLLANPQHVLRNLAGLKNDSPVGFLPAIPSNPKAEHALYDLRAIALRFLDMEFLTAIRPSHSDPAYMLDAGVDVIGYAAFLQSKYRKYAGIQANLRALHEFLLNAPETEITTYDLPAFLVTLRAARETMPALAAATAALEPLLTEERLFRKSGRPPESAKLLRRIYSKRQQFAKFFDGSGDLNEIVAGFFPLLLEEPDDTVLSYLEMKERLRAVRGSQLQVQPDATNKAEDKESRTDLKRRRPGPKRKADRSARPKVDYYRPTSAAVTDHITRGNDFRVWTVPASIKDLYEQHGRALAKAQMSWLQYARQTRAEKSAMRWTPSDQDGLVLSHLTQKVIDPVSSPPEMSLIEEAQEEQETIASLLLDVSCSMQVDERYRLTYMIADCLSLFLAKGEVPTEIIGHTTTGEIIPNVIGRNRPMHYIVFKTREEPHNLSTVHRLCSILHTGMHYFGYDGEATMWCYERLKKARAKRRVMLVVTDGDPSGTYMSKNGGDISYFTARHFRDVVACIEAEKKVEIIGVPVKADVSRIFSRSVRIDSLEDIHGKLSPFVLALLRELNEHKRPAAGAPLDSRMVAHRRARVPAPR